MAHLDISLDRASDMPLGAQLAWQLRAHIASGRLAEGERLPGVREMAGQAGVNVNTVRTVYGRLSDEGLIVSEHGRGTFVGERRRAQDELARLAREAAGTARAAGIDPRDLAVALYAEPPAQVEPSSPSAEARRRATLRAEIATLEREIAALEVPMSGGSGETTERRAPPAPQLLTAAALELVRDKLVERLQPLRADRTVARGELERARHAAPQPAHRQRAIATSTPRFESGAGGWSLRWRG